MAKFNLKPQTIPTPEEAYEGVISGRKASEIISILPIDRLRHAANHHFQVQEDKVQDLRESIREKGVLVPLIVRESKEIGCYEIIAGHHRFEAAKNEKIESLPCMIKNVSDDDAELMMIDTNIQRGFGDMKPSEIANALKQRHEILCKQQGRRTDLVQDTDESGHDVRKFENKMSERNIRRYIALTNLIPALMQSVDDKKMSFVTGVALSYLKPENQERLNDYLIESDRKITPEQAETLKLYDKTDNFPNDINVFFLQ